MRKISSDGCEGSGGAIHEELLVLQVANKKNRTRSETARNGIVICTAEIARLIEQQSAASAQIDAVADRREALESSLDAIVKKKEVGKWLERLQSCIYSTILIHLPIFVRLR